MRGIIPLHVLITVSKVCLDMGWHSFLFAFELTRAPFFRLRRSPKVQSMGPFLVNPDKVPNHSAKFHLYMTRNFRNPTHSRWSLSTSDCSVCPRREVVRLILTAAQIFLTSACNFSNFLPLHPSNPPPPPPLNCISSWELSSRTVKYISR